MIPTFRSNIGAVARFLRTPTISRTVVAMLSVAIILLLVVNIATYVMIRRNAEFNDTVEHSQQIQIASRDLLIRLVDAETGQRGYLLTDNRDFLLIHDEARKDLPGLYQRLVDLTADEADLAPRVARLGDISRRRLAVIDRSLGLARAGRDPEVDSLIQGGQGKALMDTMREEIAAIGEIEATRLTFLRRRAEWASTVTGLTNGLAGLLILVMAGISVWLVRRYIADTEQARLAVDRLNAGLESTVRLRTDALIRANEEIQRFAYIVSHDLRSPLVNVMGYTAELEQAGLAMDRQLTRIEADAPDLVDPEVVVAIREDIPEAVGFIRASTSKMDRLINAILKLSRDGRRTLVPERIDLGPMVTSIADSMRHQLEAADGVIVVESLPALESDRLVIEQVLGNLLDNAVKYLDPARPGRIVVSGEEQASGWITVRVADNGRGIADRDFERIFELFRRSGRQDRQGEGLGLAFVRNSVRRLGGSVDVESELGKGSTFILKFPARLIVADSGDA